MGTMFELFSVISSLFYGKSLISTQGVQSFKLFLDKFAENTKVTRIFQLNYKIIRIKLAQRIKLSKN